MSILNNLLGANVDPMQQQLASLLGVQVDPASLQRRARQQGLSRIGQALMQAGGGAGGTLAALGQGLQAAQGSGNDLLTQEMQRTLQFRQLQEQQMALKQRAAMQEQIKAILPNALKGMDPDQAQLVSLMVGSGEPNAMQTVLKMLTEKPKGPSNEWELRLAAANGDPAAALRQRQADALARAQAVRPSVNVAAPDIAGAINASLDAAGKGRGKAFETEVEGLNTRAQGLAEYANNLESFNVLAGDVQTLGGEMGVKIKEALSAAGISGIDQERLARERAAISLQTKTGIAELANFKGPTTDFEFNKVLEAGPALQQSPDGRKAMAAFARERAQQQQRLAEFANDLSTQVEQGQKTIAEAREELRRAQEQRWLSPSTMSALRALGVDFGKQPAAPATQAPASASGGWKVEVIGG